MIAGIDYSTRFVDVVLLDEDTDAAEWHRFALTGADSFDRARAVGHAVPGRAMSFWDDVLAVGLEQPRGHHGTVHLARVQGAVLACIPSGTMVQPWNPASWRKKVGLPGNASKQAVHLFTTARRVDHLLWDASNWGIEYRHPDAWPQDACDAYCIALATRMSVQVTA